MLTPDRLRGAPALAWAAALLLVGVGCAPRFDLAQAGGTPGPLSTLAPDGPTTDLPASDPTRAAPTLTPGSTARPAPISTGKGSVVTGGVIKIGGLFPLSGGLSALGKPAFEGANAYFNFLNDNGGIRGKKIEFITCDDQADDTRSTTCAKRLIDQNGAFIMGPSFTPFSLTVIRHLTQQGIPWIGFDGINVEGFEAPNVVTVGAPIETMAHALLPYWFDEIKNRTGAAPKRIGAVVLDVAPSRTYVEEAKKVICPKLGCEIVTERRVTYTTTEYSTICRTMQNQRVDAVWIITDPASAIKLLVQCQGIGYKPPKGFLGQHGIYLDLTLQQAGSFADGMLANSAVMPASIESPATNEMRQIVTRYYPKAELGYFSTLAYASARLTADLIDRVLASGKELTRRNVLAAASVESYDCHGLCKNVDLSPPVSRTGGNHNVWIVEADFSTGEGRWIPKTGPIDAFRVRTWPCQGRARPC